MRLCIISTVKQIDELKTLFRFRGVFKVNQVKLCLGMKSIQTYTCIVSSYNDCELRMFRFQEFFTEKRARYVETTAIGPSISVRPDICDYTVCWILMKYGVRIRY